MKKTKSIEETYEENAKGIEELITTLKSVGVKDKTIERMLKEIAEYLRKQCIRQTKDIIQNIKLFNQIGDQE